MCPTLNSIGSIYSRSGNIDKALEFYEKALKISREIEDDKAVSYCLNNIAYIYDSQGFVAKAIDYYYKALKQMSKIRIASV
ncbi:MAG: tetratricopeptide repeat protein [Bacteroidetes bacterium]|nr:tetratricopeptide repeat protein [Bacteroidota bacterium]